AADGQTYTASEGAEKFLRLTVDGTNESKPVDDEYIRLFRREALDLRQGN
ncbi:MAG: hypothetical protein RL291_95, partial [Pseudomonadota bacterium]